MELYNIKTEEFKLTGLSLIRQSGEILVLVRYPGQAGNKDFLLLNSGQEFEEFLSERKPKDSVIIFRTFDILREGLVTKNFIDETLGELNSPKSSGWLLVFPWQKERRTVNWTFAGTRTELNEALLDYLGSYVKILEEPDWLNEDLVIHGYQPDEDGQIRPCAY